MSSTTTYNVYTTMAVPVNYTSGSYYYVGYGGSTHSVPNVPVFTAQVKTYTCEACGHSIFSDTDHNEESLATYGCNVCSECISKRAIWLLNGDKCTGVIINNKIFTKPENIKLFSGIQVIKKMSIPLIEYDKDEDGLMLWEEFQRVLY